MSGKIKLDDFKGSKKGHKKKTNIYNRDHNQAQQSSKYNEKNQNYSSNDQASPEEGLQQTNPNNSKKTEELNQNFNHDSQNNELDQESVETPNNDNLLSLEKEIVDLKEKNSSLQQENNSLKNEIEDWQNKLSRLNSELNNIAKQNQLDLAQAKKKAKKTVISQLLEFINTLHLAFLNLPKEQTPETQKFISTLQTSFQRLIRDLQSDQIEIIFPQPGQDFDAQYMALLEGTEIREDHPKVKQVVSLGAKIDDQVIKPATVIA